ncbi:MAG TPA: hypothetical protein VI583_06610 [Cyclobacteriaceae bacterium]|nr:hypothetical protein [Cyclobacteriaceae bacterium]
MDNLYQEKISHLNDLVKLSRIDGQESPNEITFINAVAEKLGIGKEDLKKIRETNLNIEFTPPGDIYHVMMQYHRIIILMGIDRIISASEMNFCLDLGLKMNLKIEAIREILESAIQAPRHIVPVEVIEKIFYKYYNQ